MDGRIKGLSILMVIHCDAGYEEWETLLSVKNRGIFSFCFFHFNQLAGGGGTLVEEKKEAFVPKQRCVLLSCP